MLELIDNGINLESVYFYATPVCDQLEYFSYRQGYVVDRLFDIEGELCRTLHENLHAMFTADKGWQSSSPSHPHKLNLHPDNHETYGIKGLYFMFSDGVCYVGKKVTGKFDRYS